MVNERDVKQVQLGYASHFREEKADKIQNEVFSDLEYVKEFNLDVESQAQKASDILSKAGNSNQTVGIRLKNYNEDGVSEQDKKDIAHSIKGCWEKRASRFENRPHTVIILSGDDTVTKYDSTLSGRIYSPF
jgi:hypothetical protein